MNLSIDYNNMVKQIKVQDNTYDELTSLGKKNETYDDIIRKLIDVYRKQKHI